MFESRKKAAVHQVLFVLGVDLAAGSGRLYLPRQGSILASISLR